MSPDKDWTDIKNLSLEDVGILLDIIHDSDIANSLGVFDPRQYILYDSRKQQELFDRLEEFSLDHN